MDIPQALVQVTLQQVSLALSRNQVNEILRICTLRKMRKTSASECSISHGKGEGHVVHAGINCVCNVCGSTNSCGCVVNGNLLGQPFE